MPNALRLAALLLAMLILRGAPARAQEDTEATRANVRQTFQSAMAQVAASPFAPAEGDPEALQRYVLYPYLRAARMAPGFDLLDFARLFHSAQALLLDAHVEAYGGSGKVFDWSLIPKNANFPIVLSGGLHASNVGRAIAQVRPWAVDVSSGVEQSKGVKDAAAIRRFIAAVRAADRVQQA